MLKAITINILIELRFTYTYTFCHAWFAYTIIHIWWCLHNAFMNSMHIKLYIVLWKYITHICHIYVFYVYCILFRWCKWHSTIIWISFWNMEIMIYVWLIYCWIYSNENFFLFNSHSCKTYFHNFILFFFLLLYCCGVDAQVVLLSLRDFACSLMECNFCSF